MNSPLMPFSSQMQPQRSARVTRTESISQPQEAAPTDSTKSSDFASVLALLAANNPQWRADLGQELPTDGVSLVDRLLAEGTAPNAEDASEALRYGLLSVTPQNAEGSNALAGMSAAGEAEAKARMMAAVARTVAQRGMSAEQLLALGDARGAEVRSTLDALLAHAGTPTGVELANAANPGRSGAAAPTSVARPSRDLSAVSSELRDKLERISDRMRAEYGHDVRVVEGVRSQERQDWLFEQGRTRQGPIVTWTRHSAHTRGEAVDVIIDGRWDNPEAYARLQQIAREEGLRTLGMKDPGHLELSRSGAADLTVAARAHAGSSASATGASSRSGQAGVAGVAAVAGVASVAGTAAMAPTNAMSSGFADGVAQAAIASLTGRQSRGGMAGDSGASDRHEHQHGADRELATGRFDGMTGGTFPLNATATFAGSADVHAATRAASGVDQSQRIADIDQLQRGAGTAPLTRVTVDLPSENGANERITIDMRGNTLNTTIVTDAELANRLRMQTADLQDALGRHGLDADSVRVSGRAPDAPEGVSGFGDRDALTMVSSNSTAQADTGTSQDRDRATRQHDRQDDARREQSARERNDREPQEREQDRERFLNYLKGVES